MRHTAWRSAGAVAVVAGALAIVGAGGHVAAQVAPGTTGSAAATVGFGVPTVVDQYRPGYEPDSAVVPQLAGDPYAGSTFVSMPNGFSTTQSYIWRSDDDRQTFHLAEGNLAGKSTTCVGGGDTELQVDPVNGDVYFADLQGLTNFSNAASADGGHTWSFTCTAVNGIGVDRQWEAIDDNGGTSAVGPGPTGGVVYFDYDNVDQSTSIGNQLVINESVDGVHFGAECAGTTAGSTAVGACPAPAVQISANETIPGNLVVDDVPGSAHQHRVYAIHTGDGGTSVVVSYCSGAAGDTTAATVGADCTAPTTPGSTNPNWHDAYAQVPGGYKTGQLFPSIAVDRAGNLYSVWSQYPTDANGTIDGAGTIMLSTSTDGAAHWSTPVVISQTGIDEAVMPWVVAGDAGRIGVSYYAADDTRDGAVGPDGSNNAAWDLFYAFSTDALDAAPAFSHSQVNEPGHPVKFGNISTGGLGGAEDRSLGDFFQVHAGPQGQAVISYVDDTSADRAVDTCGGCGQTPPEAAGPVMEATQTSGPSLFASATVPAVPSTPGSVTVTPAQAAKDAFFSAAGTDTTAAPNQQLLGSSATVQGPNLVVTLKTADPKLASDLAVSPTLGGPVADWMVRWAAPAYAYAGRYGDCPATGNTCDGNIFYVGMESAAGGAPSFFTGTTQGLATTHTKYLEYPATTPVTGSISGDTITWTVPLADVGSPAPGQGLYSVTGFTSTQATPSPTTTASTASTSGSVGDANVPNEIGVLPPYEAVVPVAAGGPTGALPEVASLPLLVGVPTAGAAYLLLRRRRRPTA